MKSRVLISLLACFFMLPAHAEWQPEAETPREAKARAALDRMLSRKPELRGWLDEAYGFAVFERVFRVGAGIWGGSLGYGVVVEQGETAGLCNLYSVGLGPQLGLQTYQQLILFRTPEVMELFKRRGSLEFQGRASIAVAVVGASADPAYLPDVAIFSLTELGLMLEANANGVVYTFRDTRDDQPE